jgi:putative acetyltransferase
LRQSDNIEARAAAVTLRRCQAHDIPALVDLWVTAWEATLPAIDFAARRGWIADFLRAPAYATIVAATDDGPVGFASLEGDILQQLVVSIAARGTGVATRLVGAAKAASPGGLTLDVNQDNPRAVSFYRREGFRQVADGINPTSRLAVWTMVWP